MKNQDFRSADWDKALNSGTVRAKPGHMVCLVLSDRICFASDSASNMVGEHNSVWCQNRNVSPKFVTVLQCVFKMVSINLNEIPS